MFTATALPDRMYADHAKFRQLLQNLLSNAIKFQPDGGTPNIIIKAQSSDTHWQFSVIDNGIGIAPEFQHKIFMIFRRLYPKIIYKGSGIGLTISKIIVEQHQGEIWVESPNQYHGATFHFTLKRQNL